MRLHTIARTRRALVIGGCAVAIGVGIGVAPALAQVGAVGGANAPSISPPPVNTGRQNVFANRTRAEDALVLGDWLVYPSAFVGGLYDSNINQTSNAQSSFGARLVPSFLAENDGGVSKTTLYGTADGRIYTNQGSSNANAVDVNTGVTEQYQPLEDWTLTGQGNYTRQKDLFNTLAVTHSAQSLTSTGVGLSPTVNPQSYNQFSGSGSVQKNFSQAFAILTGSISNITYDKTAGAVAPSPDSSTYDATLRGGYWITPALYGYLEGGYDWRDQATSSLSSSGYRTIAGIGTDQIGLVRGEIFGGWQAETYRTSALGTTSGAVYGARGYYYPLPELTLDLTVDEALGVSTLAATPGSVLGTSTKVTEALATADYTISQRWSASGRGGYIHTDYVGATRRDDAWTVGSTLSYNFIRNVALTLDYQHVELSSNAALQSFTRDVATVGATLKY